MKITLITPMKEEKEKVLSALATLPNCKHSYTVLVSGIGKENWAKCFIEKENSDLCVLLGFSAIIGQENVLPSELKKGKVVEVTASSLFGYEGNIFENGALEVTNSKTQLPCLMSLTSDKFVKTTDLTIGTLINMEDYTFMRLKKPSDFILRIISDFLPHKKEINFFKEIESIDFTTALETLEHL